MNCSTRQCYFGPVGTATSLKKNRIALTSLLLSSFILAGPPAGAAKTAGNSAAADQSIVSALDKEYQKAVEKNDAATMARILADDYVLVDGNGKTSTKVDLVNDAKSGKTHYVHQEDSQQAVRIWGDTAVVTALLWAQGIEDGKSVDYKLWFSDTYVRTPKGWSYAFGQASLPLPGKPTR